MFNYLRFLKGVCFLKMEESYFAPVVIGEAAEQEAVDDDVGTGELPEAVLVADDLYAPDDSESFGRLETLISSWNKLEAHENLIASTWQEVCIASKSMSKKIQVLEYHQYLELVKLGSPRFYGQNTTRAIHPRFTPFPLLP